MYDSTVRTKEMFYVTTYSTHLVKDNKDSERGNPLPPHGLLFPFSSKGSFMHHPIDRIIHINANQL